MSREAAFQSGLDVRKLRESMGLTQQEFAIRLQKSIATVSLWERMDELPPRTVKEIVKATNNISRNVPRDSLTRRAPLSEIGAWIESANAAELAGVKMFVANREREIGQ